MLTLPLIFVALVTLLTSIFLPAIIGIQTAILGLSFLVLALIVEMRKINRIMRDDS